MCNYWEYNPLFIGSTDPHGSLMSVCFLNSELILIGVLSVGNLGGKLVILEKFCICSCQEPRTIFQINFLAHIFPDHADNVNVYPKSTQGQVCGYEFSRGDFSPSLTAQATTDKLPCGLPLLLVPFS